MKKLLFIALLFSQAYASYSLPPCNELKQTLKQMKKSNTEIQTEYEACLAEKKSNEEFLVWFKNLKEHRNEAYYMKKYTITCFSKEKFIQVFNLIQSNGGMYNPKGRVPGCEALQGWSIGRIIQTSPGSNVVEIQYLRPFTKIEVSTAWTHIGSITPLNELDAEFAH